MDNSYVGLGQYEYQVTNFTFINIHFTSNLGSKIKKVAQICCSIVPFRNSVLYAPSKAEKRRRNLTGQQELDVWSSGNANG